MFAVETFYRDGETVPLAGGGPCATLAGALRRGRELIGGVPCAEALVRRAGRPDMLAYLETNWRGELVEADVHVAGRGGCGGTLVTGMNPAGRVFRGVFAG